MPGEWSGGVTVRHAPPPAASARAGETLRRIVRQSEISGARRRVVILHADRLPPLLGKPHHHRLARQALKSLAEADRAQQFELPYGRLAIIWRAGGGAELALAREALNHLLSDQPDGQTLALGEVLTLYDLPDQAVWLLDELSRPDEAAARPAAGAAPLDATLLARLETNLAQADLSRFVRWREIMNLPGPVQHARDTGTDVTLAWEERCFAVSELAASLCPGRDLRRDPWLFRRLTRTLDSRMLAMLAAPHEVGGAGSFALNLNVATILSPEFLRFDEALPMALRGGVILLLRAADILADLGLFAFARKFAQARAYRLALAAATPRMLALFNPACAGLSFVQVAFGPDTVDALPALLTLQSTGAAIVVTGLNRVSKLRWAVQAGFRLGRGSVFTA